MPEDKTQVARSIQRDAASMNVALDDAAATGLADYLALLAKWNRVYNLTAIRDPEAMRVQHVLDSLSILPHLDERGVQSVIDVGTGGGTPGMVLAIVRPSWQITLNDIVQKKLAFLTQVKSALRLDNVEVINARVEEIDGDRTFDAVTSRAFADIGDFARWAGHLVKGSGAMYAMKGVRSEEELARLPENAVVERVVPLSVPLLEAARHLVIVKFPGNA